MRRAEAIILRTRDYGESDRLITFFTEQHGQLTGIAKGARRSKKRFIHALEPLTYVVITYADRSAGGLVRVDTSEMKNAFTALRANIRRLTYASLGCELVLELAPERQANPPLFPLLYQYLVHVESDHDPETAALLFQIRILSLSGFVPDFQACGRCGQKPAASENWFFSVTRGALLCSEHRRGTKTCPLALGTVLLFHRAQQLPLNQLWRLRFHPRSRQEIRSLCLNLIRHHLEKDLKSLKLLRQVDALEM